MPTRVDQRAAMVDRPGAVLGLFYRRIFAAIDFAEEDVRRIRAAAERGPVVYVLPTVSYMAYLYLGYALTRAGLPIARFANGGVRTILLWPVRIAFQLLVGIWRIARGARLEPEEETVGRLLAGGESVLLFLRPSLNWGVDSGDAVRVRGRFFEKLVQVQRELSAGADGRAIQLVPLTLVLGQVAVRRKGAPGELGLRDAIFGEPEAPGRFRAAIQFFWHYRDTQVKVAEPIDLPAFLAETGDRSDDATARALRFAVSGAIEGERRVIMGPPVKSARRLRLDVMRSRRLVAVVDELAARGQDREKLVERADKLVREIAAYPRRWAFVFFRRALAIVFERMYEGIDVDEAGIERVREAARRGPLVLLPSHKSHVDYLILSYVFYLRGLAPPHVAAGANLKFFPMGFLFRRVGAFFLRRSFKGDDLYAAVFEAYMRRLFKDGFSLEFFIEGGRSRTGKLLRPRYGLLTWCADAVLDGDAPLAQAVPISISYEKVVEEKSYEAEGAGGKKEKESFGALLRAGRVLGARYGRIELQIGTPFALAEALGQPGTDQVARRRSVARLAHRVTYEIAQATAVMPSALIAAAALSTGERAIGQRELLRRVGFLRERVAESGARWSTAIQKDFDDAIATSLARLSSGGDLDVRGAGDDAIVVVPPERRPRLEYYKNTLIHAVADLAIVARALLAAGADVDEPELRRRALAASRVLKKELIFRPGKGFDAAFAETLATFERLGLVTRGPGGRVKATSAGSRQLPVLAGLIASYLETYAVAVRAAAANPGATAKDLTPKMHSLGERALLLGEIARTEALSRPMFETAYEYLKEVGALEPKGVVAVEADLLAVATPLPTGRAPTVPPPPRTQQI